MMPLYCGLRKAAKGEDPPLAETLTELRGRNLLNWTKTPESLGCLKSGARLGPASPAGQSIRRAAGESSRARPGSRLESDHFSRWRGKLQSTGNAG